MAAFAASNGGPSTGSAPDRRIAAVAFVDIAGYTILMGSDEERTHRRWMAIFNSVIRPLAQEHHGRVVKSTGDGVLAEFPSALDAVEWARDVQRSAGPVQTDKDGTPPSIALRIAIHFCDVITTEWDIFGDGVNVAARLQEHADPGGIVLSEAAHDLVRGSIAALVRDIGYLQLKNIERPVKAYAIETATPNVTVPVTPRQGVLPSIAVLPLQNLGGELSDDYFADGIVEDIIISLSGLRELLVISRASTLMYRGRRTDPHEVGRALGVRYVLTGSVRRSDRSLRVSAQLCEANTNMSLWADTAEVPVGELFELQDRIVQKIVAGIAPNVRAVELRDAMRKKPEKFTAYDWTLRALSIINSLDVNHFMLARENLDKAMAEDPQFAMPVAWAARWHSLNIGQGWASSPIDEANRALELAAKAIDLDPQNALALATYGHLKSYLFHEYDSARVYLDRALMAGPSHSLAWILSSGTYSYVGLGSQAVEQAEHALRLSPFDQSLFYYYMFLSLAHYAAGNYEESVKSGRMAASENPAYTATHRLLIASLVAMDRIEEAREAARDLLRLEPEFRLDVYERTRQPFRPPEISLRYMESLRKVGLPR